MEGLLRHFREGDAVSMVEAYHKVRDYHLDITHELFSEKDHPVFHAVKSLFEDLRAYLSRGPVASSDESYDQIVSFGELFSTSIVNHYLNFSGIACKLFDARQIIRTDSTFRDARVDWARTQLAVQKQLFTYFQEEKGRVAMTQGFIACTSDGKTTTLGREGSDYSAAILAYTLRTKEVTIWKDVPGVLNADPKWFKNPKKLDQLSFREAIELAYYGASVIHPKTIKPLENANIRLHVKSFLDPDAPGTTVENLHEWNVTVPVYIRKTDQVLISVSPRDFSFIIEENLGHIFQILAQYKVKANMIQNSAISFSFCTDSIPERIRPMISELKKSYEVRFNEGLELYTIRHYTPQAIARIAKKKKILLEQKSRTMVHLVVTE
jgi:aspartate kinase